MWAVVGGEEAPKQLVLCFDFIFIFLEDGAGVDGEKNTATPVQNSSFFSINKGNKLLYSSL